MSDYTERLQQEIRNYEAVFRGRMRQDVPSIWEKVEARLADRIERSCGVRNLYAYVARHLAGRDSANVLGLGSGACGSELDGIAPLLRAQGCRMDLVCVDVNEAVLRQAEEEARKRGVSFRAVVQDINQLSLEPESCDVIVAYASLHHFLHLDRVAEQVNRALRVDGLLATVDIPTRNGYLMWDETLRIVREIWHVLPAPYKIAHTGFAEPTYVGFRENTDYSHSSFECINSEAILPALERHLVRETFVPALAMARRFFDTQFGPNYDWSRPLDRAIFEFVMELDEHYLDSGALRPETFFAAYRKRLGPPPAHELARATAATGQAASAPAAPDVELQAELMRLRRELESIRASRSWRVAQRLQAIKRGVRRLVFR
jgi:SAM-dependent methyltransferase